MRFPKWGDNVVACKFVGHPASGTCINDKRHPRIIHCVAIRNKYADTEEDRQNHWSQMMAELMGKETGYCKGRGGSMHITEVEKNNNLGSTGIVGGNQAPVVGAALRGMRPVAETMYVDFLLIVIDQLVHVGAYNRYIFGGKAKVPMVLRTEGCVKF